MPCGVVRSLVLALAVGSLAFAATRVGGEPAGELRVGVARLPDPLDPIAPVPAGAGVVFRHIFQGLVEIGERGDIEPGLAAQWSVSRDGLIWTFHLRPDVQFHNGVSLTADVVVASLARLPTGEEAATREAAEPWLGLFRGKNAVVREIRRGDGGTVQMVLAQPFSPLLAALAHPALAIVVTERDSRVPVLGTGPYRVAERSATRLVLEAVPGAPEPPRSAQLVFEEVSDDAAALAELGPGGRLDVHFPRVPPAWGGLGLPVLSGPTWQLGVLALRTHEGVAGRKAVRRAIAASLDPALVGPALGRMARPYAGYLPPQAWAVRPPPPSPHEPIRARRLLAESGSAGASLTLLTPEQRDELEPARLAEAIRLSLAVAGLTLKVRPEPPATYEPALRKGEGELALAEVAAPARRSALPPPAAGGVRRRCAGRGDEPRVLPQSRRRRLAAAREPDRLPAGAPAPVPAAPGAARRGSALHSPLRPAPVGGFPSRRPEPPARPERPAPSRPGAGPAAALGSGGRRRPPAVTAAATPYDAGAAAYDRLLGRWSRLFVPALLDGAGIGSGDVVLDVATGTGEAGAQAAMRVAPRGRVVGVDISMPMLAAARARGDGRLAVAAMNGAALACHPAAFDAVLCQLGLMFFPDLGGVLGELRRVLRPGGRLAAGVWSTAERVPLIGLLAGALVRHLPAERAGLFLAFTLADSRALAVALEAAGFRAVRVQAERRRVVFDSVEDFWAPIEAGGGRLGQAFQGLAVTAQADVRARVGEGLHAFESGGRLAMDLELLVAVGTA